MSFYTSVSRYGNNILYRGYNQAGKRVEKREKFSPTLYVPAKEKTEWVSFSGNKPVRPVKFETMRDAKDYINQLGDVEGYEIHGMRNYIFQYITTRFPSNINFEPKFIEVGTIDIEVESDDGFPEPSVAEKEVISIAYKSNKERVWRIWGLGEYDSSKSYIYEKYPNDRVEYIKCEDETSLLMNFLRYLKNHYPDVITGWYIRFFDIPYLVNRITKILGEDILKMLSPWGLINQKHVQFKGGASSEAFEIVGIQILDMLDLFQKFGHTYGPQESYKLDHIAYVVLNERKLSYEEHGNLHSLYKQDHQKFIEYNIKDIDLVMSIDAVMGLIDLVFAMAYRAGVNYSDTLGTTAIWDSIIYRELNKKNIIVSPPKDTWKSKYPGGYVKEPVPGRYDWVVSFDLNSLYPNIIVQYNMSPETLRNEPGHPNSVEYWLNNMSKPVTPCAIAANGVAFSKDKQGILPEIISAYYDERKIVKKKMLSDKQERENLKEELTKIKKALGN